MVYQSGNPTNNWNVRSNVNYTEPIGERSIVQASYDFNYSFGESNKRTYNWDDDARGYLNLDSLLSNIYSNDYYTQRGGLSYRYVYNKLNASAGVDYENADLVGHRLMPRGTNPHHTFQSLLPNVRIEFKPEKNKTARLVYRSNTNAPSINQLQEVINNSNPLVLSGGNTNLQPTNSRTLFANYNQTSLDKGMTFFVMLFGNITNNYITNTTVTHRGEDMILQQNNSDTIWLRNGAQYRQPINMDGYFNTRLNLNFGIPIAILKSNLNVTSSAAYSRQPGRINAVLTQVGNTYRVDESSGDINYANNYSVNLGLVLGSNISEQLDFNVGYNATYNNAINTLQSGSDNSYFRHNANVRLTWEFWRGFKFYSTAAYDQYRTITGSPYNEAFIKWDAGFGKKFLNNQMEVKIMAYDLLNRTNNYSRNVTDNYIEDAWTRVLTRYFMLTFTYTLRSFGTPAQRRQGEGEGGREMRMQGGGGGGFGGPPPGRF
jgi:hypothetical protein